MKTLVFLTAVALAPLTATAASAATPLTVTYQGTLAGTNTTYNVPFEVPVTLTGVTTAEDAADGSFSFGTFSTDYSGAVSTFNNASGAFVGNLFRITVGGATFADFNFTNGFPNFTTGVDYAVTLSGGAPLSGAFGVAVIDGGSGIVRGDLTAAVPEPAAWAMLLGGFAFVGAATRRRRAKVRVTYA